MRSILATTVLASLVGLSLLGGCTVSFDGDPTADGKFKCQPDAGECLGQDQSCQQHEEEDYHVCTTDIPCTDRDGDGYGSPDNESFRGCPACEDDLPGGCEPDCVDDPSADLPGDLTASEINPGATELCDGVDNNCSGTIDDVGQGPEACGTDDDPSCPSGLETPDGTQATCDEVDGTAQCVIRGRFDGSPECGQSDNRRGVCEDGEWTEVSEACRKGE